MITTTFTISQMREALMSRWETDKDIFKSLRDECGTYVFDAVMAVLLGGTGSSKPHQKAYLSIISNTGDVGAWKANAGLKANKATGFKNYQQRGFFNFPNVDNNRLKTEFPEEITLEVVCNIVIGYGNDCFRKNMRNMNSDPKEDFVKTLHKVVGYAFKQESSSSPDYLIAQKIEDTINLESINGSSVIDHQTEETVNDMRNLSAYLSENEFSILDSISCASELLLTELDAVLQTLKKCRMDAVEKDDDESLSVLTAYRDTLNQYRIDVSRYLDSIAKL